MSADLVQLAEIGRCRVELIRIHEHGDDRWLLFLRSPFGARIDTLSEVIRETGGHFGGAGDNTAIVYDDPTAAFDAFSLLVDSVRVTGFWPHVVAEPPGPAN